MAYSDCCESSLYTVIHSQCDSPFWKNRYKCGDVVTKPFVQIKGGFLKSLHHFIDFSCKAVHNPTNRPICTLQQLFFKTANMLNKMGPFWERVPVRLTLCSLCILSICNFSYISF